MWGVNNEILDEQYELTLILFSIISAAVFQYFTFIMPWYYQEPSLLLRKDIVYLSSAIMRRLFLPIIFSLTFWLISIRCTKQKDRNWKAAFKMNAWIQLSFAMFYMLQSFILFLGNPLVAMNGNIITLMAAIPTVILISLILIDYWKRVKNINFKLILLFLSANVILLAYVEFFAMILTPVDVWKKIIGELPI